MALAPTPPCGRRGRLAARLRGALLGGHRRRRWQALSSDRAPRQLGRYRCIHVLAHRRSGRRRLRGGRTAASRRRAASTRGRPRRAARHLVGTARATELRPPLRAGADATLIVLGQRRDGRVFGGRFGRSVVRHVVRRARCPVVIVKLSRRAAGPAAGRVAVVLTMTTTTRHRPSHLRWQRRRGVGSQLQHSAPAATTRDQCSQCLPGAALLVLAAKPHGHAHRPVVPSAMQNLADSVTATVVIVKNADPTRNWELR
jgi:hypothetical protein